jgi:hypothetical protein
VCQGHDGFLAAHALFESLVVGPQVGVLAARGPVGGLDEGLLQPTIALTRLGAQPFPGADLGLRAESCPTDQMSRASELVELDAQFRYDNLGNALVDTRHARPRMRITSALLRAGTDDSWGEHGVRSAPPSGMGSVDEARWPLVGPPPCGSGSSGPICTPNRRAIS